PVVGATSDIESDVRELILRNTRVLACISFGKPIAEIEARGDLLSLSLPRSGNAFIAEAIIESEIRPDLPGILRIKFHFVEGKIPTDWRTLRKRSSHATRVDSHIVLSVYLRHHAQQANEREIVVILEIVRDGRKSVSGVTATIARKLGIASRIKLVRLVGHTDGIKPGSIRASAT